MKKTVYFQNAKIILLILILSSFGNSIVLAFDAKPCPSPGIPLPVKAIASNELRFAAIGDTGEKCENASEKCSLIAKMLAIQSKTNFNHLFFLGDNVYEKGNPDDFKDKLYGPYRQLVDNGVILRGVVGNHDVVNAKGTEIQIKLFRSENLSAQKLFFDASVDNQLKFPPTITETYYSFSEKPKLVEFFALDSSLLSGDYSQKDGYPKNTRDEQLGWLEKELGRSKKAGTRWRVVLVHHPLYCSAKKHGVDELNADGSEKRIPTEMKLMREIEPLLRKYDVKLVLAGHAHNYERIAPQWGIYHFVSGAGAKLRTNDFDREKLPNYHVCGRADGLSFMLFSVKNDSITFWAIGANGEPFDAGVIN